ncbi:hypothetical protein [Vibrio phage vB_pir03]|nr:hypothetical protein [Vibrio phage vB_pir03]
MTGKASDAFIGKIIAEHEMGYVDYSNDRYYNPIQSVTHHQTKERDTILKHQIKRILRSGVCEKAQMGLKDILALDLGFYDYLMNMVEELNIEEAERTQELEASVQDAITKIKESKEKS